MWDLWDYIKRVKCDLQRQIDNIVSGGSVTADSETEFTNKSGNISQWTNDANYVVGDGTGAQYIAGNGTKITFPTIPTNNNQLTNGSNYISGITSSDVTAALTYVPVNPNGTGAQYIAGNGTKITFPTIPTASDYVDRTTAQSVGGAKTLTAILTTLSVQPTTNAASSLGTSALRYLNGFISTIDGAGTLRLKSNATSAIVLQQTADTNSFAGYFSNTAECFIQAPGNIPTNTFERLQVYGNVKITVIAALATPATLFLVSDSGVIKSRTPAQVLSDIGIVHAAFTASGDGVATTINIPHGLGSVPTAPIVSAGSADAAGITWVSADSTNIIVHYSVAPASGTNNLTFNISYKK